MEFKSRYRDALDRNSNLENLTQSGSKTPHQKVLTKVYTLSEGKELRAIIRNTQRKTVI